MSKATDVIDLLGEQSLVTMFDTEGNLRVDSALVSVQALGDDVINIEYDDGSNRSIQWPITEVDLEGSVVKVTGPRGTADFRRPPAPQQN